MAKKKSPTTVRVLAVDTNNKLVLRAPNEVDISLEALANVGVDADNAKLTLVVELSKAATVASNQRAPDFFPVIVALQTFLAERGLGAFEACATCCCVDNNSATETHKKPKKPRKPKKT